MERDDVNLSAKSHEDIANDIDNIIQSCKLSEWGVGMHLYDMSLIPDEPEETEEEEEEPKDPPTGEGDIHITESRITRRENLTGFQLNNGETLGAHYFKWEIEKFSAEIQQCNGCPHCSGIKKITDKENKINVEQWVDNQEQQGVIKQWSYMTDGGSFVPNYFVRDWAKRTVGKDKYEFNGAGYCIVVIRKDDTIDLIDYRQYGNKDDNPATS